MILANQSKLEPYLAGLNYLGYQQNFLTKILIKRQIGLIKFKEEIFEFLRSFFLKRVFFLILGTRLLSKS